MPAESRYSQMMLVGPELSKSTRKQSTDSNYELALYQRVRIRNYLMAFQRRKEPEFNDAISYIKKVEVSFSLIIFVACKSRKPIVILMACCTGAVF